MFEKIIYLLTAFLGFIILLLIGFKFNSKKHINLYLLLFFAISSLRFLAHGLYEILPFVQCQKQIDVIFNSTALPLTYLYFYKLNQSRKNTEGKELLHLVIPLLLFLLYRTENQISKKLVLIVVKMRFLIIISYSIIYAIASYKLLKQNIWKRNSVILVINRRHIKLTKWTKLLYGSFFIMLIRVLFNLTENKSDFWYLNNNNFLWVGALIWIILYIIMFYSPEFLYGTDMFQNKIKEFKKNDIAFDHIWINTNKQVINIQDAALKEKIADNIQSYIADIEHFALNTKLFLTENFKLDDLANKLNLPKSHITYLFKYHATISFSDFKKIIRIQKSMSLIKEGYLKNNTLESLAVSLGFSSYSPFFTSFKSITGMSPKNYFDNQ